MSWFRHHRATLDAPPRVPDPQLAESARETEEARRLLRSQWPAVIEQFEFTQDRLQTNDIAGTLERSFGPREKKT